MVDVTKDLSKKDQMSFVITYYYKGSVCGCFLNSKAAEHLDAAINTAEVWA